MIMRLTVLALATVGLSATGAVSIHAQAGTPLPPALVGSVAASVAGLEWTINSASPVATQFEIHAGSAPGLSNLAIVSVPANSRAFSAAAPAGTYYVRIFAVNASGRSAASNEVTLVIGGAGACAVPGAPTDLVVIPFSGMVTLRWNAPLTGRAPSGYSLLVGSSSGALNLGTFAVGLTTTMTAPSPLGSYFIRVVATNACGSSAPSAEVSFGVPPFALTVPAGTYVGTVFDYAPPGGALTSFTLQLNGPVPAVAVAPISARLTDNRGCVKSTNIIAGTGTAPFITFAGFPCNGEDFVLRVRSVNGNVYSGDCAAGLSSCTYLMIRQ